MRTHAYRTLVVTATNRGPAVALDLLASVRWGMTQAWHMVVVDDTGGLGRSLDGSSDHTVIRSALPSKKAASGFKNNEGIAFALRRGDCFDVALCLDDDALLIGRGVDAWALQLMESKAVDLVGVADRERYLPSWPRWQPLFLTHVPEAAGFVPEPETLFYAALWQSRPMLDDFYLRGMLVPEDHAQFELWPDTYVSWLCQMTGHSQYGIGHMDTPVPPLYCNHPNSMRNAPQPWILHPDFKVFHSLKAIPGFPERAARLRCAALRAG